jgi:hypothetical protein
MINYTWLDPKSAFINKLNYNENVFLNRIITLNQLKYSFVFLY